MTARLVPAVGRQPRYERRWLRPDVTAGIAVTALVVPKNLGYAAIAGIPLQNGLYAAAAGAIIYALSGSVDASPPRRAHPRRAARP
jgi:sulfate permease, SulP family